MKYRGNKTRDARETLREMALLTRISRGDLPAARKNAIAHAMAKNGSSKDEIIEALATENERLSGRVTKLLAYVPQKFVWPDGRITIWRCPDHLVPKMGEL